MSTTDEKVIKDAQYRKGLSIAWFNATNSATEMVKLDQLMGVFRDNRVYPEPKKARGKRKVSGTPPPTVEERIEYWRSRLLEEHKAYYATVIANVGANYKSEDTVKKLKDAAEIGLEALRVVWRSLSEDERRDGDVLKVAKELRGQFPNEEA